MGASNTIIRLALLGSLHACSSAGAQFQYCPRDVTRPNQFDCTPVARPQLQVPVAQQLLPHEMASYPYAVPYPYPVQHVHVVPQPYVGQQPHMVAYPVPPPAVYAHPYPYPMRDDVGVAVATMGAFLLGATLMRRGPFPIHFIPRR